MYAQKCLTGRFSVRTLMHMGSAVLFSKPESSMSKISLTFKTVKNPDFFNPGGEFYVEAEQLFDADDYAEAYGLNRYEIDPQDIHSAQDAAARLNPGEWLQVEHDVADEE